MKEMTCECGKTFLIPSKINDEKVFFRRRKQSKLFFAKVNVGINRDFLFLVCKECVAKLSVESILSVITIEDDVMSVNWLVYKKKLQNNNVTYINHVLDKLGVLSRDASGNWIIMSQGRGCINPMHGKSVNLYFTSSEDALAYAKAWHVHKGHIMKIGDVMTV